MKICPVGAELFHADGHTGGQTDMTKLIASFNAILRTRLNMNFKQRIPVTEYLRTFN
jgi:hypothetical protein